MNRLRILGLCAGLTVISLFSLGCPYNGPQYPVQYGQPTSTPTPAPLTAAVSLVVASPYAFSPSTVTILHGGSVVYTDTTGFANHTVYFTNTAGTACAANGIVPANSSITVTAPFVNSGTYYYHCSIHSACGTTTCSSTCTGMTGIVVVQ